MEPLKKIAYVRNKDMVSNYSGLRRRILRIHSFGVGPLDNDRYPGIEWTTAKEVIAEI